MMKVGEGNTTERAISRRGFLGAAAAASTALSSFIPSRDAGAEELAQIDKSSQPQTKKVVSPTANLTFKDFNPVTEKELPKSVTDVDQMVKVAYYHGLVSREVLTKGTFARKEFIAAIISTGDNRAEKLRPMIIALSNLITDEVLTKMQARDFLMRHWHTASYITTHLDKDVTGRSRLDPNKASVYYEDLMEIKDVKQGDRLEDRLINESDDYVKTLLLVNRDALNNN